MIKNFTPRLYQETIFSTCALKNTLVVLPTGLGKTNIFLMIAAQRLRNYPNSKILLVGPTRPLISQYKDVFLNFFDIPEEKLSIFTGHVTPKKRAELWQTSQIIFTTPQGLENDIISSRIDISDVSLLGIDEAHRAVKDYSYVWISKEYVKRAKYPRVIGMTASPGDDKEKILEVCQNLFVEDIEVRTPTHPEVKPYIKKINVKNIMIDLPPRFLEVKKYIEACIKTKLLELKTYGYVNAQQIRGISKRELLGIQGHLVSEMNQGNRDFETLKSLSLTAETMKISHGLELLESQGIHALYTYMNKLIVESRTSKVKAVQNLVKDVNFKSALIKVDRLVDDDIEHPKFDVLKELVDKTINVEIDNEKLPPKIIVFTQFRDTAVKISQVLEEVNNVKSKIFVGQMKKGTTGLSQKQQIEMIQEFREGLFNVIIMTSVGEEGLDIPSVDKVIFFEPVPSVIRSIQRRGRTGRQDEGIVNVLVSKKTRDEAYLWSSIHKERRMYDVLKNIKKDFKINEFSKKEKKLQDFFNDDDIKEDISGKKISNVTIYSDYREKSSNVLRNLLDKEVNIKLEKLESADYILSPRVGIEYKKVDDFVSSLVDGRLLSQVKELKRNFERSMIIVEGTEDIYAMRKIHPNSIKGMMSAIMIGYGIPIHFTKNSKETTDMMYIIAKREQEKSGSNFSLHGDKKPLTLPEQQEYIVSSFPSIGPNLAKILLKHFGSIKKLINASVDDIMVIDGVGKTIATRLKDSLEKEYKPFQ